MKITVITGSPHKNGTSALLANQFIEGASRAGHDVFRFNSAFGDVHPCIGCERCVINNSVCVYQDSMNELNRNLLAADLVVFVTPFYFFGMSAQMKIVLDRLYANDNRLHGNKKSILMATAADSNPSTIRLLVDHYKTLVEYFEWEDKEMILALGCGGRSDIEKTDFPSQAYQLGLKI